MPCIAIRDPLLSLKSLGPVFPRPIRRDDRVIGRNERYKQGARETIPTGAFFIGSL